MSLYASIGICCHSAINILCVESSGSVTNDIHKFDAFCSHPLPSLGTKSGLGYLIKNVIKEACE